MIGTRDRLIHATRVLVESGGFAAATVSAIGLESGLAPDALFRHYSTKDGLLVDVMRNVVDEQIAALLVAADAVPAETTPIDRLEVFLRTFGARALRRRRLAWALLAEPSGPEIDAERLRYHERYREIVEEALVAALTAGEIPEQDVVMSSAALMGGCREALAGILAPSATHRPTDAQMALWLRTFIRRSVGAQTTDAVLLPQRITA